MVGTSAMYTATIATWDYKYDPKLKRGQKMFQLLDQRNKQGTIAHHLESEMGGDASKVVPLALGAIQSYVQVYGENMLRGKSRSSDLLEAAKLSIVYELVRSWHVTVLDSHNN